MNKYEYLNLASGVLSNQIEKEANKIMNRNETLNTAENYVSKEFERIVNHLLGIQSDIDKVFDGLEYIPEENKYISVRLNLQVDDDKLPKALYINAGDPSFDQDHKGYWASGIVTKDTDIRDLAFNLRKELINDFATDI